MQLSSQQIWTVTTALRNWVSDCKAFLPPNTVSPEDLAKYTTLAEAFEHANSVTLE